MSEDFDRLKAHKDVLAAKERKRNSEISNLERRVVEAAVKWAPGFPKQYTSRPEDDDLYFAVNTLIAARLLKSCDCIIQRTIEQALAHAEKASTPGTAHPYSMDAHALALADLVLLADEVKRLRRGS